MGLRTCVGLSSSLLLIFLFSGYWSVAKSQNQCPTCVYGECNNLTNACNCEPNWFGEHCNVSGCENKPCLNGGTCTQAGGEDIVCSCPPNFGGALCQTSEGPGSVTLCATNTCGIHGMCVLDNRNVSSCVCNSGYGGEFCNETVDLCLASGGCANGGRCVLTENYFDCKCTPGWNPVLQCQHLFFNICNNNPVPCKNGASCTVPVPYVSGPELFCTCTAGFTGTYCNETYCDGDPCQNGGTCNNLNDTYSCSCPQFYSGKNCQTHPCDSNMCKNGGTCIPTESQNNQSFMCNCTNGFQGELCQEDINECNANPCANGGTCINQYGKFYCDCAEGYEGDRCLENSNDCASMPCQNGGTCSDGLNSFNCSCPSGYQGVHCEIPDKDTCLDHGCSNGGTCIRHSPTNQYTCQCPDGFTGSFCKYSLNCSISPPCYLSCQNGGVCAYFNGSMFCKCAPGWGGPDCSTDVNECSQLPCQNGGTCTNSPGNYSCSCPPRFTGTNCDIISAMNCTDNPCMNGGTCARVNGLINCTCPDGFSGDLCNHEECPYNCSSLANNGNCELYCFTEACNYDGGHDCYPSVDTSDPFRDCPRNDYCRNKYSNGYCDHECNNARCLYDGADCVIPSGSCSDLDYCHSLIDNGVCDRTCSTPECPIDWNDCQEQVYLSGYLVLYTVTSADVDLSSDPERQEFADDVGRLTHTLVEIYDVTIISEENIIDRGFNVSAVETGLSSYRYWRVTCLVNIQYCQASCPTTMNQVVSTLQASYSRGQYRAGHARIAGAATENRPQNNGQDLTAVYVVAPALLVVIVVLVIGVLLGKRVRDNGGISPTLKRIRVNRTWQVPGGLTPEPSSLPQSREQSFLSDRRSSSVELVDSSAGAVARKDDRNPHLTWSRVEVPVNNGASDGSTCVVGHTGKDSRQWTKLHSIAARHIVEEIHEAVVEEEKQKGSVDTVNAQGPGGYTPLMVTILSEKSKRFHPSVPTRSDSSSGSEHGESDSLLGVASHTKPGRFSPMKAPRHQASSIHSPLSALITSQTDLNLANDRGETALHVAAKCSHTEYMQLLLKCKADPNLQDIWGQSPLHVAIGSFADSIFKILLEHPSTNLDLKSKGGVTPLMLAVKMLNNHMVHALITKGVEISTTDSEGRTAVHWAAMMGNLEALKELVSHGPDTIKDVQNGKGETALFLACREGHSGVVHHLLDCFANATLLDNLDRSPFSIACEKQHLEIVELLQHSSQGTLCPPPSYMQKSLGVPVSNAYYHHGVKVEAKPSVPPQSVHHIHHPPHHRIQTQPMPNAHPMVTSSYTPSISSIPRVSSLEAELDKLIASTVDPTTMYPTYLQNYPSPPLSHGSPPYMGQTYNSVDGTMNHMGGNVVHDGAASSHSSPGIATESRHVGVNSMSPQDPAAFTYATTASSDMAMPSNQLTAYSCQTCPTSSTASTADQVYQQQQAHSASRHALQHMATYTRPATSLHQGEPAFSSSSGQQYIHPASTSAPATSSYSQNQSVAKPAYSTALANISMHNGHGRPSPPLAQTVSPHMVPQPGSFSPPQSGPTSNNSPSNFGYLSPPREPGDYPLYSSSYNNTDALSCLTPSPEDYSSHCNERSPPGQTTTVHTLGHYEQYQFQPVYEYGSQPLHNHITASNSMLGFNSRETPV